MLNMLSPPWPLIRSTINYPRLNYNRDKLNLNWIKSRDYYRASSQYCASNHLLVQILTSISIDKSQTPFQYYNALEDTEYYFASIHGLVNDTKSAKAYMNGYFYGGKNSYEVYLLDTGDVDINSNWRDWNPVKVRYCNFIDYSYSIPSRGLINNIDKGITIISINIKMLAMQYYYYLKSDTDMLTDDVKRNIGSFVVRYPLCNMLPSVIDNSYINEYRNRLVGIPMHEIKTTNPIALNTTSYMFDKTISDVIKKIRLTKTLNKIAAVASIPMINDVSPLLTYGFNHHLTNTNNIWILAFLQYSLLQLGQELSPTKAINETINKKILHESRIIKQSRYLENGSKTLLPIIEETIDSVVNIIN